MTPTLGLLRRQGLLHYHSPDLPVVRYDWRIPLPSPFWSTDPTLEGIEAILQPIVHVVDERSARLVEIKPELHLELVVLLILHRALFLPLRDRTMDGLPPGIAWCGVPR